MAFCSNCGKELTDSAKFCASCGTSTEGTVSEPKTAAKKESVLEKLPTAEAKEKLNAGKEKVSAGINKLPFKKLAEEKIPAGARAKFPILDNLIPFANQIVCGLAVLLVIVIIAASGDDNSPKGLAKQTYKLEQKALKVKEDSAKAISLAQEAAKIMEKVTKLSANDGLIYLQEIGRLRTGISASSSKKASSKANSISIGTGKLGTKEAPATDFIYELNKAGDGVVITGYKGKGGDLVIPSEIEGYPVVEFKADALSGFSPPITIRFDEKGNIDLNATSMDYDRGAIITSVVFPDSITSFSDWNRDSGYSHTNAFNGQPVKAVKFPKNIKEIPPLFSNEHLETIIWPESLEIIGEAAFYGLTMTSIVIPDGVKVIGRYAFGDCKKLISVKIPDSIEKIEEYAFRFCSELTEVDIPAKNINHSWTSLAGTFSNDGTFQGCNSLSLAVRKKIQDTGYKGEFVN
jgi:hypothetical protein